MIKLEANIEVGDQKKTLSFESEELVVTIGRESKNDFQIPVTTISRQHCRLSLVDNQWFLEDLGSAHGTMLNSQKLPAGERKLIRSGDTIVLSKVRLLVSVTKPELERGPGEKTEALAVRAVEDILGRLGGSDADAEQPFLRIMSGPDEGKKFYFRGPMAECVLGRSRESDLVVNDPNSSRRHALIKRDYNGVTFQCLGAKNLSTINGKEVHRNATKRLKDRDEIAIGAVKILFIDPDAELLSSLGDIPGFEQEPDPQSQPVVAEEEVAAAADGDGAPSDTEAVDGGAPSEVPEPAAPSEPPAEVPPPEEPSASEAPADGGEAAATPGEEKVELPAPDNDPAIAQPHPDHGRFRPEIILFIVGFVIILAGVAVLLMLLF